MDELEIRRRLYADPRDRSEDVQQALTENPDFQAFADDLNQFDSKLAAAMTIPVPTDLADKLILRQSMHQFQTQKRRNRVVLALAASVAFAVGISLPLLRGGGLPGPSFDPSAHALAHIEHEASFINSVDEAVDLQRLNVKMAGIGAAFERLDKHVYFANYCDFDGVRSLHLVMEGEKGKVTVFLVPGHVSQAKAFGDQHLRGIAVPVTEQMQMMVVGEAGEPVEQFESRLREQIRWEI